MKHILLLTSFILIFITCSNDKNTNAVTDKKTKETVAKPNKKSPAKSPYWSGFKKALNLSDSELEECRSLHNKYNRLKKDLPPNDKEAFQKWRKSKNNEFKVLLGLERYKQKAAFEKQFFKKK